MLDSADRDEIINQLDAVRRLTLPPIPAQLGHSPRRELDIALLKALGIEKPNLVLDNIYHALTNELDKLG